MASRYDYRTWDEDDEDPNDWARPGSAEAITQNRQLRRKPSQEDRLIRQKNRRTAADEGDQVAINKRAEIVRKIQDRNATLEQQLALVAALEEFDRHEALRAQASRGQVDLENTVAERLSPVRVHEHHTASTDWLGDIDTVPTDWHQRVASDAAVWYQSRPDFVKADTEEFSIQANAKASNVAGAYGSRADVAKRTFLDYVAFLHTGASGLDQIQQTTAPDGVTNKPTSLPTEVFDNFAPDINAVNQGVSGTESSTRNPLIQEIMSGGSGMDSGAPEKVNEHDTGDNLSWSPPSGMQKDTAPGWSDGDPGNPEDPDGHHTDFESDSEFSKHTSASLYREYLRALAVEQGLDSQNEGGPMSPAGGDAVADNAGGGDSGGVPNPMSTITGSLFQASPAIGYVMNMDDYRRIQAEAASADPKADGHRGGLTASSTPDAGNAADDLFSPEEEEQAKKDDPVGGKVGRNLQVKPENGRYMVHDADSGENEGSHHSEDAARDHIDYLNNRVHKEPGGGNNSGLIGGAGWHQTTRYARGDGFKPHTDAHQMPYESDNQPAPPEGKHTLVNGEELSDNSHGNVNVHQTHPLYSEAASGLDQIDQTIDPNNKPKVTGYPTEVAFPLNKEFQEEDNTHGTGDIGTSSNYETVPSAHRSAAKSEPYYNYSTPDHIVDGSQHAEDRTTQALHHGDAMSHARAGAAHADVLNNMYDSGYDDSVLEAHHKSRMNYHDDRASKLHTASNEAQRHEAILNKVADMFGASDLPHQILNQVPNSPATTPINPDQGSKSKGVADANKGDAPTFSDNSSHVPAGANAYAEGYHGVEPKGEKNVPASVAGPGKATTKAGAMEDYVNEQQSKIDAEHSKWASCPDCKGSGSLNKKACPSCEGAGKNPPKKTSSLITTAADRSNPDFMKGYFYAANWKVTSPLVAQGSASFEAGLYAGLTDTPAVQPHFIQACAERGQVERLERHAAITDSLVEQLGMKYASTSLYLDTMAPNTTPAGDGSTPLNGKGNPGPLNGKETGAEGPGGPSPYNGAEPHGKAVVPGAAGLEAASPTDHLMPASGYTTPRAMERASSVKQASVFRRTVQAGLLREVKIR